MRCSMMRFFSYEGSLAAGRIAKAEFTMADQVSIGGLFTVVPGEVPGSDFLAVADLQRPQHLQA